MNNNNTLTEELEDERCFSDALMNEVLLLRQAISQYQHPIDVTSSSDRIQLLNKKVDSIELRLLRLERRSNPRDWNLYKIIWRLDNFNDIYKNAESYERSLSNNPNSHFDPTSIKDISSPVFFSKSYGYSFYLRVFPYGADTAKGKYLSLYISLCPGPYDEIPTWPFQGTIEISLRAQGNFTRTHKQIIVTNKNNTPICFQKPIPTSSNPSCGILCFISHEELFKEDNPWLKNGIVFFEIKIIDTLYAPLSN